MRIIEKNSDIEKKINSLIAGQVNSLIKKKKQAIRLKIISIIESRLSSSLTLALLSSGVLKYDFGLEFDPSPAIINAVANSVTLGISNADRRFKNQTLITLYIQPSNYNNLLTLSIAEQDIKGGTIPWLEWLLLRGDEIIIYDYSVEYGPYGRSGGARMEPGGFFRVNPIYSGTADDNFITRIIAQASNDIVKAIEEGLK